VLAMLWHMFCL